MADERAIPLLPCGCIDDIIDFYRPLGFEVTYRQERPNPYVALRRADLDLHFFGMPGFDPEQSYGTCIVQVSDTGALYRSFADGMRAARGTVPSSGIPRMTRPRRKQDNVMGFSVIDPGGNWIRVVRAPEDVGPGEKSPTHRSKLARALHNAAVLGDSKGDHETAARILDKALAQRSAAGTVDLVEALVYRAELAVAVGDPETAEACLTEVREMELTDGEREQLGDALSNASDLA